MRFPRSLMFLLFTGLALAMIAGLLALRWKSAFFGKVNPPPEHSAVASAIKQSGNLWMIPREAAAQSSGSDKHYVMRMERLRARRIVVVPVHRGIDTLLVQSDPLHPDDLLLLHPESIRDGAAITITGGLSDLRILELTVEAGIAAAEKEDLAECARFISPRYEDRWGFSYELMTGFLKRAFREFDRPKVELVQPMDIDINADGAVIHAGIRVEAFYGGKRNYLLGGPHDYNRVLVRMDKMDSGWKVAEIRGLEPLGFEEKFIKLLGAEVGLPLSAPEKVRKKEACMPCRNAMADRFGTEVQKPQ